MTPNLHRELQVHNVWIRCYVVTTLHPWKSPQIQYLPNYGNDSHTTHLGNSSSPKDYFPLKSGEGED